MESGGWREKWEVGEKEMQRVSKVEGKVQGEEIA